MQYDLWSVLGEVFRSLVAVSGWIVAWCLFCRVDALYAALTEMAMRKPPERCKGGDHIDDA